MGKVESVVSAGYKTHDRIELNLLRASRDVATFARLRNIDDRALFVMAPGPGSMSEPDLERIENVLGEQAWSLEKLDFRVVTHDSAQDTYEWAGVPAV